MTPKFRAWDKEGRWYGDGLSRTYRIDITKEFLPYYKVIGNIYENKNLLEVENENQNFEWRNHQC